MARDEVRGAVTRLHRFLHTILPDSAPDRPSYLAIEAMGAGERIQLAIEVVGWSLCLAITITAAMLGVPYALFRLWFWLVVA